MKSVLPIGYILLEITMLFVIGCSEDAVEPQKLAPAIADYKWQIPTNKVQTDKDTMRWTIRIESIDPRTTFVFTDKPFTYTSSAFCDNWDVIQFRTTCSFYYDYEVTAAGNLFGQLALTSSDVQYHDTCTFSRQ